MVLSMLDGRMVTRPFGTGKEAGVGRVNAADGTMAAP
jgi:hypothetical protein